MFCRVQEIFKIAQSASELVLKIIKKQGNPTDPFSCKPPAPVYPRNIYNGFKEKENVDMVEVEEKRKSSLSTQNPVPNKLFI